MKSWKYDVSEAVDLEDGAITVSNHGLCGLKEE